MPFCGTQTILVLCVEMQLGVTSNSIPKVDLTIALNRILTHIHTMTQLLLRHPSGGVRG